MELTAMSPLSVTVLRNDGLGVALLSSDGLPLHQTIRVEDSEGNNARVNVYRTRRTLDGRWLGFGSVYEGWLEEQTPLPLPISLRSTPRSTVEVLVRTDLFPGLEGRTLDLSLHGLQLELEQSLEVGENVEVTLDLADGDEPMDLWASVRWCQVGSTSRAGLQFTGATASQRGRLEDYLLWHDTASRNKRKRPRCESTVFSDVLLQDVFKQEDRLVVRLSLGNSLFDQSFNNPVVRRCCRKNSPLKRVTRTPLSADRYLFRFIDVEEQDVLTLESELPDVTICMLG